MFRAFLVAGVVAWAVAAWPVRGRADEPPRVTLGWLQDQRVKQYEKTTVQYYRTDGLRLIFNVTGLREKAHSIGRFTIEEAADDKGNDLRPTKKDDARKNRLLTAVVFDIKGDDPVPAELALLSPGRCAEKIARLRGEFTVMAGGEVKVARFPKLKSLRGQSLHDPLLKEAGLELSVMAPARDDSADEVTVTARGNLWALDARLADSGVGVVDDDGKTLDETYGGMTGDDDWTRTYTLKRPLADDMTLRVRVLVGQKAVKVPFDLRDVPLP